MITEFLEYCRHNLGLQESTVFEYGKDLHSFASWLRVKAGVSRWSQVKRQTIESWVAIQHQNGTAPATIKRRVSAVRRFYQYAWLKGLCTDNPAKYVSTPRKANRLPNIIPVEDISAAVFDKNVNLSIRFLIAVMAESGLRVSEAINLQPSQIDMMRRSIKVIGKGNKQRVVFFGDTTAQLLAQLAMTGTFTPSGNERNIRYDIWQALRTHTEVQACNPHTLRHTFATTMVENGAQLESVAMLLGHESVTTTERYTHMGTAKARQNYADCAPKL